MALQQIKYNLSHLRQDSWHRRLVKFAFGKQFRPAKACPYWWFRVPASPFVAGVKLICLLIKFALMLCAALVFSAIGVIFWLIGIIFGYKLADARKRLIHPLKGLTDSNGMYEGTYDWRVKPYQVLFPAAFVAGVIALTQVSWPWLPRALVISLSVVAIFAILGLLYKKVAHPLLKKVCPDIVWVDPSTVVKS